MAFPTIPTVAAGRVLFANDTGTASPSTRTFPAFSGLTYSNGDLLIAIVATYQSTTNPQFSSWSNGFTECSDQGTSTTMGIGVAYKWTTGSETGSLTVSQAGTVTGEASLCLLAIPGAHASTAPECGTIANGTSAAADPASFNPAGWGTEDTLWIAVGASGMTSGTGSWTATGTTYPTNYTNGADSNTTDSSRVGQVEIAVAFRQLNAASEDVATFGVDTSNARNSALVIAVRPAPVVHDTTGAVTGPGTSTSGSLNRFRAHATSGAVSGPGSAVTGALARSGAAVSHDTSGAVSGPGSATAGAINRFRAFATSGAIQGPGSAVAGSLARTRVHDLTGDLSGQGSQVTGALERTGAAVTHDLSGVIVGPGAAVIGILSRASGQQETFSGGAPAFARYDKHHRLEEEEEVLEAVEVIKDLGDREEKARARALVTAMSQGVLLAQARIDWAKELANELQRRDDDEIAVVLLMAA